VISDRRQSIELPLADAVQERKGSASFEAIKIKIIAF
jgi:hypothetical protein